VEGQGQELQNNVNVASGPGTATTLVPTLRAESALVPQFLTCLFSLQIFGMIFSMVLCCAIRRNREMV